MKDRVHLFRTRPDGDLTAPPRDRSAATRRNLVWSLPLLLLFLAACGGAEQFPQTWAEPRSDFARSIDGVWMLSVWLGLGVGVVTFAVLGYILFRFRYRPGQPEPEHVHGNTRLELAWTFVPALILAVLAVPTVQVIFETQAPPPEDALTVEVIGYQWWWEFRYPMGNDTVVTANEVHVPVGQTVELVMNSADVIHSFWIPQMGGKRDVIPRGPDRSRWNRLVFTPEEPGVYLGQCAEFCGESHALMKMRLVAHAPDDFAAWLRNEAAPAVPVAAADTALMAGEQIFRTAGCAGCHAIRGVDENGDATMVPAGMAQQGPDLTHLGRRQTIGAGILANNASNLANWIRDPDAIKPGVLMPGHPQLTNEQLRFLVAYMQSLD